MAGKWQERGERVVKTRTLSSILAEHLPAEREISLLSIDVEGHDLCVLRSIDLAVFRPKLIIVEMHRLDINSMASSEVVIYLKGHEYRPIAYDSLNGYFADVKTTRENLRLGDAA